ncbi:MAG: DUF4080 domain-containing protein [Clostridia bacterium]|nr:DUF4080 domain-containing protein [Clostridia bacterium]
MRLTLTGLASQYIHMPLAPFCLKKAVEEALPVPVTICDININEPVEDSLARLMATEPTHIGFCVYIWNREVTARLVRRIKALAPEVCILVGGPEVTHSPEETFAEMPCDYLLRGAGEESLPSLLLCLMDGGDPAAIPGVCTRERIVPPAMTPPPRSDLYDEAWHSALNGRMVYVETSRGCPFACAFCLSGQKEKVQFMPQEEALALLIRLGASGTDTVKLIDRTFNCDRQRTRYLLGGLMNAKAAGRIGNVCYHLEVAADLFDDETLDLLASAPAGLFQMEAGLQSFHVPTLEACRRHTDMPRLIDRLQRLLLPGNIHLHIDLIAGLPQEDFETFGHSFDQAYELRPHQLQLGFLKVIHGSHLRESDWGQRFAPDPPYEVLSTPWMTYAQLRRLHGCAEAVERLHNSGRFTRTLALALEHTGMRPFDLFLRLGDAMSARQGRWSLDALTLMVHEKLLALGVPADALRDAMIHDRLATDNTGYLPPLLQSDPERLKRAARLYREDHPEHRHPRCALLSAGKLAVAVWREKHPVTQRGKVEELSVAEA